MKLLSCAKRMELGWVPAAILMLLSLSPPGAAIAEEKPAGQEFVHGQTSWPPEDEGAPVEVFVTGSCADCLKTIGFLDGLKVRYRLRRLDRSDKAERTFLNTYGKGVIPLVHFGDSYVRGYLPDELHRLLKPLYAASSARGEGAGSGKTAWVFSLPSFGGGSSEDKDDRSKQAAPDDDILERLGD